MHFDPLKLLLSIVDLLLISYLRLEDEGKGDANAKSSPSQPLFVTFTQDQCAACSHDLPRRSYLYELIF